MEHMIDTKNGDKVFDSFSTTGEAEYNNVVYFNGNDKVLKRLVILITNTCNMSCKYCIADKGKYKVNNKYEVFKIEDIIKIINNLLEIYSEGIETIQFFGGEPLLKIDYIEQVIIAINNHFTKLEQCIPKYSIVTNGTLLNSHINKILSNYKFDVTISLDGLKDEHDSCRVFKDNSETYNIIYNNIINMDKSINKIVEFSISNVNINKKNSMDPIKIVDSFVKMGFKSIVTNIIFIKNTDKLFSESEKYKIFLEDYTGYLLDFMFSNKCYIYDFKIINSIIAILTKKHTRKTCGIGINSLTINTHGEIQSCYLDNEIIGVSTTNLEELVEKRKQYFNVTIPSNCTSCWCNNLCNIWCRHMNDGKVIKSRCIYNKISIDVILKRLYVEKDNKTHMINLIRNIKKFKKMYI